MKRAPAMKPDFVVSCHGNIYLLRPVTEGAREWLDEHVSVEGWQWFAGAVAIDQHYINGLCGYIAQDGLHIANTGVGFH